MLRYIRKAKLGPFIEQHDWAGFARAYNGPGYAKQGYHLKIAKAYRKHCEASGIGAKDRWASNRNALAVLKMGDAGNAVRRLQRDLSQLGYPITVDGDFGPVTWRIVMAFQKIKKLDVDGIVGPKTFEVLARNLPQPANLLKA